MFLQKLQTESLEHFLVAHLQLTHTTLEWNWRQQLGTENAKFFFFFPPSQTFQLSTLEQRHISGGHGSTLVCESTRKQEEQDAKQTCTGALGPITMATQTNSRKRYHVRCES